MLWSLLSDHPIQASVSMSREAAAGSSPGRKPGDQSKTIREPAKRAAELRGLALLSPLRGLIFFCSSLPPGSRPGLLAAAASRLIDQFIHARMLTIRNQLFLTSSHHGLKDFHVARATTEISCQSITNVSFCRIRISFEQIHRGHHHARGADSALRSATLNESLLQCV